MPALNVWMNGELVGEWGTRQGGVPYLRYAESWRNSKNSRSISLSLPLTPTLEIRGVEVDYYFDNLLPDSPEIRRRLREKYGVRSNSAFALLSAIGRDCAGAVQLLPPGAQPEGWDRIVVKPLTRKGVAQILGNLASTWPLGNAAESDFRLSLAGAHDKTALLRMGGRWHRPQGATPTTHILKLPIGRVGAFDGDLLHSVENEWLCGQILRRLGLPVAESHIDEFEQQRVLVVQRFDRQWMGVKPAEASRRQFKPGKGVWIARLPQEDFCQATGRPPTQKYESDGGPSMQECLDILATSENQAVDQSQFLLAQFAFWLLAAIDGHGKNFSIAHRAGGRFHMTPLYDVVSAWPIIGNGKNKLLRKGVKMAMAVRSKGAHYRLHEIVPRHWQQLANKIGDQRLWPAMRKLADDSATVIDSLKNELPTEFPSYVFEAIRLGVRRQAARLEGI